MSGAGNVFEFLNGFFILFTVYGGVGLITPIGVDDGHVSNRISNCVSMVTKIPKKIQENIYIYAYGHV